MWIVKVALQRPYTFLMLAVLIVLLGVFSILNSATDIFPTIRIPIVAVIWRYTGLLPDEMANRIVLFSERTAQTTVNDVEHTESQSLNGTAVVKYFFQPKVKPELAFAQITAISQSQLQSSPPGTTPPFILSYDASTVPILQLALSSETIPEQEIFDLGNNIIRTQLATVEGAALPYPLGGKQRQVQVDLDPELLRAHDLSGDDVVSAIAAQNLILPAGTEKIGLREYFVKLNASPTEIEQMNDLPVKASNDSVIFVRDVAHVRDGYAPQTNIARVDGKRAVLMNVLKTGDASTIEVINGINGKLGGVKDALPQGLKLVTLNDQSVFVRSAISAVIRESIIAALLTGLMILLFLGSWRSTLIITVSIPLSILASIACLSALGETINIMTLGGLALAVGILVDDATVTIENINYQLEQGKEVEAAILDGARQIALPALVSTLSICIVFVPMFLLSGIARYLFVPLAEAVVFAMLASYLLSRTLIPTLANYLLQKRKDEGHSSNGRRNVLVRFQKGFEQRFEQLRLGYRTLLGTAVDAGIRFPILFLAAMAATALIALPLGPLPGLGQDFFPSVDAGSLTLHFRAASGTRIEQTAVLADQVEKTIRQVIPADEITTIVDNLGLPYSGINLAYTTAAPVGPGDADVFINTGQTAQLARQAAHCPARAARGRLSGYAVLVPAGRYHQPDSELRAAGADRCPGFRQRCRGERGLRQVAAEEDAADCRCRRSAHPATPGLSRTCRGCRSHQGPARRSDAAERGLEHAGVVVRQFPDHALLLDRSEDRHAVQRRLADAAVPDGLAERPGQYPAEPAGAAATGSPAPAPRCLRTSPLSTATSAPRWSRISIPSRPSTSTAASRTPTLGTSARRFRSF